MTIFSDFLTALGVPHTDEFSDGQCHKMPFQSLFGLSKLLATYGVATEGVEVADHSQIDLAPLPMIAQTPGGLVIVTGVTPDAVSYISRGQPEQMPRADFERAWTGIALLARKSGTACEPSYGLHRRLEFFTKAKKWILAACVLALAVYAIVANGVYMHPSLLLVAAFDVVGLYFTYLLVGKTWHIKSQAADRVCGVLKEGGCDDIMASDASKFFGLFSWSEVGFSYFSVSLAALLMFPQYASYLAAINVCCLPYTVWSIWYQRTQAHTWCTLCVSVQCTLWLLFFCYLGGGWLAHVFPLGIQFFVLGATYVAVMLGLNRLTPLINKG